MNGWLIGMIPVTMLLVSVEPTAAQTAGDERDRTQPRPAKVRVAVPVGAIQVGDGDTVVIEWGEGDVEIVRILGIDTPETQNVAHNLPYAQPFGREATAFARGAFAVAERVELLRADTTDGWGRTLGYVFLNGRNYSELVVRARLATESVSHFGDNGFPAEAQAVLEAARAAGPMPFEPPFQYRRRMREVTEWMRANGMLPAEEAPDRGTKR